VQSAGDLWPKLFSKSTTWLSGLLKSFKGNYFEISFIDGYVITGKNVYGKISQQYLYPGGETTTLDMIFWARPRKRWETQF